MDQIHQPTPSTLMKKFSSLTIISIILLSAGFLNAQTRISLFDHLSLAESTKLSLTTDVTDLIINKKATDYQNGILQSADGKSYVLGVKPRGKFRRRISDIPPLKLKLKKKLLEAEGLIDSLNELKLVLPTTLDEQGNELVIREYLAYRMYEQISPYAVRARLIDLVLINTNLGGQGHYEVKAILLEDEEETAARLGGQMLEVFGMTIDSLQVEPTAIMVQFQHMIGNTDWDIPEQRNVRFLKPASGKFIPIPFDFDFCGLVDAPYATPQAGLGIRTVRDRYLMTNGLPPAILKTAAQSLLQHQPTLLTMCKAIPLPEKDSGKLTEYLEKYFAELQSGR